MAMRKMGFTGNVLSLWKAAAMAPTLVLGS